MESQIVRKTKTNNHEMAALFAATLTLTNTNSRLLNGRTATIGGMMRSPDQRSGFENALPMGSARSTGMLKVATRMNEDIPGSLRINQENGAISRTRSTATNVGSIWPERRHSNHA